MFAGNDLFNVDKEENISDVAAVVDIVDIVVIEVSVVVDDAVAVVIAIVTVSEGFKVVVKKSRL